MRHFERATLAARYDAFRPQVHAEVFDRLHLPALDGSGLILDVACGTGHSTAPLLKLADNVIGCDISDAMLEHARRRCPAATFIAASADALPLADDSVDVVTVAMALHWFDQRGFVAEAVRVLRPGGSLVVYNYSFAGEMVGNPDFGAWMRGSYLRRFPAADRRRGSVADLPLQPDWLTLSTWFVAFTSTRARETSFRPVVQIADQPTLVMCDQLTTVELGRLTEPAGFLTLDELQRVDEALSLILDL